MKKEKAVRALIAIPAFNEAQNILYVLSALEQWKKDVVVIDDGSLDNTAQLVIRFGFECHRQSSNKGLAGFYKTAGDIARSKGYSHLIALDGDGQHDPGCIPKFLKALETADLVSGNRFHHLAGIPSSKLASNLFAIMLFKKHLNIVHPDVACGFRGMNCSVIEGIDDSSRFGIIYEMLARHAKRGQQTDFVPIPAIYQPIDPLNTSLQEIEGLLDTIGRYNQAPEIKQIKEAIRNRINFRITLFDIEFMADFAAPGAYLFTTDTNKAALAFEGFQTYKYL
jgi:glycosyltransferase involved in cell wall biosynthesis